MDEILRYFPELTSNQISQFSALGPLYREWNEKINVISRKDIDNVYTHHILHSLAIAKFFSPKTSTTFMDLGTGGGFPAIPLAIMWPDCTFHLVDRIAKKLRVAQDISEKIGLKNVTFQHGDALECKRKFDYVVSRAVMPLPDLIRIVRKLIARSSMNSLPSGLLCLKGGDLTAELALVKTPTLVVPLSDWFNEEYFKTKDLIYAEI